MVDPKARRSAPVIGGGGFNPYAAGKKVYGGGRPNPNSGKVDNAAAARGYAQRDQRNAVKKDALQDALNAGRPGLDAKQDAKNLGRVSPALAQKDARQEALLLRAQKGK